MTLHREQALLRVFGPLLILVWLLSPSVGRCGPTRPFPASDLQFQSIFATKPGADTSYVLLGSGFLRTFSTDNEDAFIKTWLGKHPKAKATPISSENTTRPGLPKRTLTYIWVEEGVHSLNVDLVREGIVAGGTMKDMVEFDQKLDEEFCDPRLNGVRADIEKELAETPAADRPKRFISETDYKKRLKRVGMAELKAMQEKKGIWSDEMKAAREAEEE